MSDLVKRLRSNVMPDFPCSLHEQAADRIEALEAALREIAERSWHPANAPIGDIARAALAPEQEKSQ
jgi:hypothetical protein